MNIYLVTGWVFPSRVSSQSSNRATEENIIKDKTKRQIIRRIHCALGV